MPARPQALPPRLRRTSALSAAIVAAIPALACAATYTWTNNAPGNAVWGVSSNWNPPSAFPGSDAGTLNDIAAITPPSAIGGTLTISYTGVPAPSIGSLTLARGNTINDTLRLSVDAPLTVTGSVTLDSGTANPARLFLDINSSSSLNSITLVRTYPGSGESNVPGLHVKQGTTSAGSLLIGTATSSGFSAVAEVSGGTLTVTGPAFTVGAQNAIQRSALFVDGGTLISTNPAGLVIAQAKVPDLGQSTGRLSITSGTAILPQLTLGGFQDSSFNMPTNNRNDAQFDMTGGALYLGNGGLVAFTGLASPGHSLGSTYVITLGGGTLGAVADWTSSARLSLFNTTASGNATTLRAADPDGAPHNILLSGTLTGAGGFRKTGTGTLTLTGQNNNYSGGTQVSQGTLLVASQLGSPTGTGTITVENGATYGGSGNNATVGSIIVNSGGHVAPGLPGINDNVGILNVNNLTFNPGSFYDVDFTANASANDQIAVLNSSALTLSDPVNITLNQLGQPFSSPGSYTLFTGVSNLVGLPANLHVANQAANTTYQFTQVNTDIVLSITQAGSGPVRGTWFGTVSSAWPAAGNWVGGQVPGAGPGDFATFLPIASNDLVNLNGNQRLAGMEIDSGTNSGYTFAAGVAGSKLLLDNGTSSVTMMVYGGLDSASNDIVLVSNTHIAVSSGAQLLLSGTLSSGTANSTTSLTFTDGGTLVLTGANTYGGPTTISFGTLQIGDGGNSGGLGVGPLLNNGFLLINRSDAFTLPNPINGTGSLIHNGPGATTLTGAAAYSGATTIQAGTLIFGGATAHSVAGIAGPGTLQVAPGATLTSDGVRSASWKVDGTHIVRPNAANAGTSRVNALTIAGATGAWTGKLDLTDNALIVNSPDSASQAALLTTIIDQVASGNAGGTFNGPGITSSTLATPAGAGKSLAIIDAGDLSLTGFRGETGLDANTTIVVISRNGDATLDGKVDALDLNLLAAHWQQPAAAVWSCGDFTGDGKVDALDLNVLAANWQFGVGGGVSGVANFTQINPLTIPEPASTAIFAFGAALLLKRRKQVKNSLEFHLPRVQIRGIYIPNLFLGV